MLLSPRQLAALMCTLALFQPTLANSVVLLAVSEGHVPAKLRRENLPALLLCIFFLPACVLEEKSAVPDSLTAGDLRANGYTTSEIGEILRDQAYLATALRDRGRRLVFEENDTPGSIRQAIRELVPGASDAYVELLTEFRGRTPSHSKAQDTGAD